MTSSSAPASWRAPLLNNRVQNEADIIASPSGFARAVLNMDLYPKQAQVMDSIWPVGSATSFRSCNEGGKTKRVICGIILWHLNMFPRGMVISTSGSFRQLKNQLMPALQSYAQRFPRFAFRSSRIQTEWPNCFYDGFSTADAGRFEGYHAEGPRNDPDAPLLIIVDEAKTVKDPIFEAIERCHPTRLLIASSPGCAEGEFYRSQTTKAQFYKTFKQTASECPHFSDEEIARVRVKWGPNHPLVASMLDAEFMSFVQNAIVDLRSLEDLLADPPAEVPSPDQKAFCDFAWGGNGDENVMALRRGNIVTLPETFRAGELHAICGRFIAAFMRYGLKPSEIEGDEGGGGKLIIDQLAAMGWPIGRINNGSAPRFSEHYVNVAAEMWFEGAMKIARREIILPDDNDLKAQMLNRKSVPNAKGKLAIERKEEMKKASREGGAAQSPDRADAVFGAMMPPLAWRSFSTAGDRPQTFGEQLASYNDLQNEHPLPGGYCP